MKKNYKVVLIFILCLNFFKVNSQVNLDTASIRLIIDSALSLKQNSLAGRLKKEKTIISNLSFLKRYPTNNLLFSSYQILADINVRKGNNEIAKSYIDTCYIVAKKLNGKKYNAKTKYIEGIYFKYNGKSDAALKNWFEALSVYKDAKDEESELVVLSAIAREYNDVNQNEKAEKYLVDIINRKIKIKDEIGLSNSYNTLANVFVDTKRYDKALEYFNKALVLSSKLTDTITMAYTYNNLARVFNKQEKLIDAKINWERSYDLFMKTKDAFGTAMIINNMAYIQINLKNYDKGVVFAKRAVDYASEHDIKIELQRAHSNLLDAYFGLNDFKNGYKEYEIIIDMKDAEFNKDVANSLAEVDKTLTKLRF